MNGTNRDWWVGWCLVAMQFALLGWLGSEALRSRDRQAPTTILGGALGVAGGVVSGVASAAMRGHLSAHPAPSANAVLLTSGIYGVVRHPIYSGLLLAAFGGTLIARTRSAAFALVGLAALFSVKSRFEERLLIERFPEYRAYAQRVPRFVPRWSGRRVW